MQKKHGAQKQGLVQQKDTEFQVVERRFVNVWNELESKFRKELKALDKYDSVKKMKMREEKLTKKAYE